MNRKFLNVVKVVIYSLLLSKITYGYYLYPFQDISFKDVFYPEIKKDNPVWVKTEEIAGDRTEENGEESLEGNWGDIPELGEKYRETKYLSDAGLFVQYVWEFRPGLAVFHLDNDSSLLDFFPYVDTISKDGWILRELRIKRIDGLEGFSRQDMNEEFWNEVYLFRYLFEQKSGVVKLNIKGENGDDLFSFMLHKKQQYNVQEIQNVDCLIDLLTYETEKKKREEILGRIRNIGTIQDIKLAQDIIGLYEGDEQAKLAAIIGIRYREDTRGVYILEEVLRNIQDSDSSIINEICWALGELGKCGVEVLIGMLEEGPAEVKKFVALVLGSKKVHEAVQELIDILTDDTMGVEIKRVVVESLGKIGDPQALPFLIMMLRKEDLRPFIFQSIIDIGVFSIEYLIPLLKNEDIEKEVVETLAKIGASAVEPLLNRLEDSSLEEGITSALVKIGNASFIPILNRILKSEGSTDIRKLLGVLKDVLNNLYPDQMFDYKGDISELFYMDKADLEMVAISSLHPGIRAIALYLLGKKYDDGDFLKDYIFDERDDKLYVKGKTLDKLEIAAILNSGVPAREQWWGSIASREERIKYIRLVLEGDFTDERTYTFDNRNWVCVQYATQLLMNFVGYGTLSKLGLIADRDIFEKYGLGYIIFDSGYGIPLFLAHGFGHAFNALFLGENLFNEGSVTPEALDINNWILIEPQDDDFSPNFGFINIEVYLDPVLLPDGQHGGVYDAVEVLSLDVIGYPYGWDSWGW